jgi:hypothetical protein
MRYVPALLILLLAGCATPIKEVTGLRPVEPELVSGRVDVPNPSAKVTLSVGEIMLVSGESPASRRYQSIRIDPQPELVVEHKTRTFRFPLESGPYKLVARSDQGELYLSPIRIGSPSAHGGLFVPKGQDSATQFMWWWYSPSSRSDHVPASVYSVPLPRPVVVSRGQYSESERGNAPSGPVATLTYAGVASGQIKFAYKEFTASGMARPAFTQEVSLDYVPGEIYAYKDARFIVHEADRTHIVYTLLNGL